jgi:hypothetical protein
VDANETAIQLLKLVEDNYPLDEVIKDYKKALTAVTGTVTIKNEIGKTPGGRKVPIISQQDIQTKLSESILAQQKEVKAGTSVTTNSLKF